MSNAEQSQISDDSAVAGQQRPVSSPGTGPAPTSSRPPGRMLTLVKRLPFTTAYVAVTLVLAIALGTLWSAVEDKSWYDSIAFGLPAFSDGRWYTLITGLFFALYPVYYVFVIGAFAILTGFAEWKLGTRRTILLTFGYQFAAVLIVAGIFWIFQNSDWTWAAALSTETDVGFSAGMMAAFSVATATVRPPWRLRLRLAIWAYVLFSILFIGQMADAEHLVALALSLPLSTRLAGKRALRARALPTRQEVRLLVFVLVLLGAALQLIAVVLPARLTPFGLAVDDTSTGWLLVANLIITVLVANGLRHGLRWAWWIQLLLLAVPVGLSAVIGVAYVVLLFVDPALADVFIIPEFVASALLSLTIFVVLIVARRSFRVPRRSKRKLAASTANPDTAKQLLRQWGGDTISWMTTWSENRHMITEDGRNYIAFVRHAGVAVALGDPVGPPESRVSTINDFAALCDRAGMVPFLFSCTASTVEVTDALGWQSAQVAEDNLIDLPQLEFKGKKWQDIRTALNKAPKEGIEFRMVTLADQPWALVNQVQTLSEEWLGDKKLPEMGFTLGGLTEALDPEVKVGLAIDAAGVVQGVTSWMPVYGGDGVVAGWTLDLMRRADGGFRATMEFLIASSCLYFKAEGAQFVSLSGAPLARSDADPAGVSAVDKLLDTLGSTLEPVYGFRSLHAFKAKFQPRLSPMYMVFRDEGDLPRIGIAITRAYLPTAGLGDVFAMVKH